MQRYVKKSKGSPSRAGKIKNALIIGLFALLAVPAAAQKNHTVLIAEDNPTVAAAIKSIEKQTGLIFTYDQMFDLTRRVVLPKTSSPLADIMNIIIRDTGRSYLITDQYVVIRLPRAGAAPANAQAPVPAPSKPAAAAPAKPTVAAATTPAAAPQPQTKPETPSAPLAALSRAPAKPEPAAVQPEKPAVEIPVSAYLQGVDPGMKQIVPRWAVKTNLLADATATISLGVEVRIGRKLTLDLPVSLNPWIFSDNTQWRRFLVQPELRWWGHEAFNRHFIGVNLGYMIYNIGNIDLPLDLWPDLANSRYEGHMFGAGVSVGHHWILGRRLNLEATLGLGYAYTEYTQKECATCGELIAKGTKHYFGPTKAGLSLVYIIK